ncbi:MAG: hypothetical protein ACQEQU_04670 [Spirochaetota bacterium]
MKLQITPLPHELRQVVPSGFQLEYRGGFEFLIDESLGTACTFYGIVVRGCSTAQGTLAAIFASRRGVRGTGSRGSG